MKTKLNDVFKEDSLIVIEKSQMDDKGNRIWPRRKGNNWRETIQIGDIIDAKDEQDKWYETLVRYVYPKGHEHEGKMIVHFIGWNLKWDEILLIEDDERVAKRHTHTRGPHRPIGI